MSALSLFDFLDDLSDIDPLTSLVVVAVLLALAIAVTVWPLAPAQERAR